MKKTILISIIVIIVAALLINYLMPSCLKQQEQKIANLETVIQNLKKETMPLAFQISGRTDSTISFGIKFLDENGNEVSKYQQTIKGRELFFDFFNVKEGNNYLAFPDKVFSDAVSPSQGIDLKPLYEKDGFPMIYQSENISEKVRKSLIDLFATVKSGDAGNRDQFGNAVHDLDGIKTFEPGITYQIITHTKGGIEIIEK